MNGTLLQKPSARRVIGMAVGIVIIGLGIALFKQSHLGNDSISALNMRLAELFGISLGVQNIAANLPMFAIDLPEGAGKVVLAPDCRDSEGRYRSSVTGHYIRHPLADPAEKGS